MITITCPECSKEQEVEQREDATYTTKCYFCGEPFSYRIVNGQYQEWHPPIIAGIRVYNQRRKAQPEDFIAPKGKITRTRPDGSQDVVPVDWS